MTKFIYIDKSAAKELIGNRVFQSLEFEQASHLVAALRNSSFSSFSHKKLYSYTYTEKDGVYLFGPAQKNDSFILFDLTQCNPFMIDGNMANDHDILTIFFRVLRFAIKIWDNLRLNPSSEFISAQKSGVVFPFPATSRSFRLCIAKAELPRRQDGDPPNNLLVFHSATREDGNDGVVSIAPVQKVFKLAAEAIHYARGQAYGLVSSLQSESSSQRRSIIEDVELQKPRASVGPYLPFAKWKEQLTIEQSQFVTRLVHGPERISGPAGCGKTLCLILKCLHNLRVRRAQNEEHHSIFFTHSISTKKYILQLLASIDTDTFYLFEPTNSTQSLKVTTLQEYCISQLGSEINPTEYIDRDAMDAKNMQLLYVLEAIEETISRDFNTYRAFMSKEFCDFLEGTDRWATAETMSHEISVVIKGRASEDFTKYKKLPARRYGLPLRCEGDCDFSFRIFSIYKDKLIEAGVYDSDDIILSATGQFNTPIWRRRRSTEGFHSLFIDETHLFNLNELSVFHYVVRDPVLNSIVLSIDRAQAIGDRYMTDGDISSALLIENPGAVRFKNIFRYSPDIVDLAQSVTSSGATLFTNFENPLAGGQSIFDDDELQKCKKPAYYLSPSDHQMIVDSYSQASLMAAEMGCSRADIAIVAFSPELLHQLEKYAAATHQSVEVIKDRGDIEVINRAQQMGRFVISAPDYVGGLEFDGVVLLGVDKGRVPPAGSAALIDSRTFLEYSAHNQLYVAITRARYRVMILASRSQALSKLLDSAVAQGLLVEMESLGVAK